MRATAKAALAVRIWLTFLRVHWALARRDLPDVVRSLSDPVDRTVPIYSPWKLSRAVDRSLRIGARRPRCLINALVLYRLLRAEGEPAELVIGLPDAAPDHDAHAWVELGGVDVGPPPGQGRHLAMARFS